LNIHIPQFVFAGTSDAKEKDNAIQFGGLPKGLPAESWPVCSECEAPMTFLFQAKHHPEHLPLGREGRTLYLFQCEGEDGCTSWEADAGCNKALILEPELGSETPITEVPDEDTMLLPAISVASWISREQREKESDWTHFGGAPIWIQSEENVGGDYRFAVQLDYSLRVKATDLSELPIGETSEYEGKKSYQLKVGEDDFVWISEAGENEYHCPFANFGDSGSGYVFVNAAKENPSAKFIWQCY
jgi:hypothetical protein